MQQEYLDLLNNSIDEYLDAYNELIKVKMKTIGNITKQVI